MKLFIISDVHGNIKNLQKMIDQFLAGEYDYFIILGDVFHGYGSWYDTADARTIGNLLSRVTKNLVIIKGNCDIIEDEKFSPVGFFENFSLMLNNHHIYFAHGHRYFPYGILEDGDIYCHGHSHINGINLLTNNNKTFIECNPGSISFPRGGSEASYMVIDENSIRIYNLENILIKETKIKTFK